jgi:hypothetical protein
MVMIFSVALQTPSARQSTYFARQQVTSDVVGLDFVSATTDLQDFGIAYPLFNRASNHVAVTTVDLHGLESDFNHYTPPSVREDLRVPIY